MGDKITTVDDVAVHEIKVGGRYIIVLDGASEREAREMGKTVEEWWNDDEGDILILGTRLRGMIHVVRVDEVENEQV